MDGMGTRFASLRLSRICAQPGGNADKEGEPRDPCRFVIMKMVGFSPWDGGPLIDLLYTSYRAPPEGTSIFPMILLLLLLLELIERSWKSQSLKSYTMARKRKIVDSFHLGVLTSKE